ncbi:uncharacterized protein LOC135464736 isoform X2 [Liolophura sinensis]|uniref:uncharacterized protein LOC135464736 isoform X2 n=1 Tax=Liolophura sinensis TaxID=3198878 RepID=UPI003158E54B
MDGNSSDNSHSCSEIGGGSWSQGWEHEISSLSGLNLGSSLGLQGLVDDKEIAARAVAFVVNSTRKGIVPLCSDIANLLRSKQSLEKKILLLRQENEFLRSSQSGSVLTSHSTSPIPASLNSYDKGAYPADQQHNGDGPGSRPSSRCSQCCSTLSNSPKLDKGQGYLTSDFQSSSPSGGDPLHQTDCEKDQNGVITEAIVHVGSGGVENGRSSRAPHSRRKNLLPEMTSEPNGDLPKITPAVKTISRETQCSFSRKRDQGVGTTKESDKQVSKEKSLVEDLGAARKEIEILKARLKELEMREDRVPKYFVENEVKSSEKPVTPAKPQKICGQPSSPSGTSYGKPKPLPKQLRLTSMSEPLNSQHTSDNFLPGCKCKQCQSGDPTESSPSATSEAHRIRVNGKLEVKLGDHVLTKDEATGYIRYLGHLDGVDDREVIYAGLALDAPVGKNDGFVNGNRYFMCNRDHGLFLPVQDIVCAVPSKDSNKVSNSRITNITPEESKQGAQSKASRKSAEKSQKKVLSESQPHSKLGERIVSMLQKPGKPSDQSMSSHITGKNEKEAAVSNPAKPIARGDKRWLAPYTEIAITSREGPVV